MKPLRIQRLELERDRTHGVASSVLGALWLVFAMLWILDDPSHWLGWMYLALAACFIAVGVVGLRKAKRRLAEFTSEHGPEAGKQTPIR